MLYSYPKQTKQGKQNKEEKTPAGFVFKELRRFVNILNKDKDILFEGQLLETRKYGRQRLHEWLKEFKDDKNIKNLWDTIKSTLETRAVKRGLSLGTGNTAKAGAAFFIFFMKNAFGWKDVSTSEHNINLPIPILGTPEQLRDKLKQSPKRYIKAGETYSDPLSEENSDTIPDKSEDIPVSQYRNTIQ